jgi:hypothetical protein
MAAKKARKRRKRPGKNYRPRAKNGLFMKARHHRKGNPSGVRHHRRRYSNAMFGFGKKRRHARRHNPMLPVTTTEFTQVTLGAVAGGFGARAIPENLPFLTKYNNGWKGYALNLVTGYALSRVARWLSGAKAEEGVLVGTILMTGGRIVSDQFGKTIVTFGNVHMGNDPAFNFRRIGKYVQDHLPPLPVPTPYPSSGPVSPLPVGTSLALPASAQAAAAQPSTIAAAASAGKLGYSKYGRTRFM